MAHPLILIPARMGSTRLPGKPLALIDDKPMILHVVERAKKADIAPVWVATDHEEIAQCVKEAGHDAFLTKGKHASGSDRIYEALCHIDKAKKFDIILNLQGDLPNISSQTLHILVGILEKNNFDIATLATEITCEQEKIDPNIVKIIASARGFHLYKALYFTRACAPYGEGQSFHHIGLYGYKRHALEKFIALPPSPLEQREKLEQLRALENDMTIGFTLIDQAPISVDTAQDLEKIRRILPTEKKEK